jgi:hypothetical protein
VPSFLHSKDTKVIVGAYDLSGYFREATVNAETEALETTTFGVGAKTYVAGLTDGSIELAGLYSGGEAEVHDRFKTRVGTEDNLVTYAPEGLALGNPVTLEGALQSTYSVKSTVGGLVEVTATLQAMSKLGGSLDLNGKSLQALTAVTAAGNGVAVDNAALSSNGGIGFLHVIAFTGTDATIKIQHSADDVTYADLLTFTAATGLTSERKQSLAGVTVNRYLRRSIAGTFTSITFALSFARR